MNLITGANGFLGAELMREMTKRAMPARGTARTPGTDRISAIGDIGPDTDWNPELRGVKTVIHTAARVHRMIDGEGDSISEYRRVNAAATANLAQQASAAGVKRFIFISTIKVNGESTPPGEPFTENDIPHPEDAYALSKWEAEQALHEIAKCGSMEVVVIRSPLVYGPGARANLASLIKWVKSGIPLPLASIKNKRSLIAIENLVDLIITCIDHPGAGNTTFLAADGHDLSTPELIRLVARGLDRPARLLPFPAGLLGILARLAGKRDLFARLCGSLQVDIGNATERLGWRPPAAVEEAMCRAVQAPPKPGLMDQD